MLAASLSVGVGLMPNLPELLNKLRQQLEKLDKPENAALLRVVREGSTVVVRGEKAYQEHIHRIWHGPPTVYKKYITRSWEGMPKGALAGALTYALISINLIMVVKADGPGWVVRIFPNRVGADCIIEVWSGAENLDNWPDETLKYIEPDPDLAALAAVKEALA